MSNIEVITLANESRLKDIEESLAEVYKIAFAGSPWLEVSKCPEAACRVEFCTQEIGSECPECVSELVPAYETRTLNEAWRAMIEEEDAIIEVETDGGAPVRATIARPTTPGELWGRKYGTNPAMKAWLAERLPAGFIWIEDSFADLLRRPQGNLKTRGATLARIATNYGGMPIYTRTIAPQIVAATLRDLPDTNVFVGTKDSQAIGAIVRARSSERGSGLVVPDQRTLLAIKALRSKS